MAERVEYRVEQGVARIVMDDGKRNALTQQTFDELNRALDRALADRAVVVLRGRPQTFSAGFDLSVLRGGDRAALALLRSGFELAERLLSFPFPVVAACTGHALAMGAFLLLSADYRIGSDGDYKIATNEVAIGMIFPFAGLEICRQRLAPAHFSRATLLAEVYHPDGAMEAGFLDRVVAEGELDAAAGLTALQLSKLDLTAHAASKLRARSQTLEALRAAIEADDAYFRARI